MDPEHHYEGRWQVTATDERFASGAAVLAVEAVADPWRYREPRTYRLNAAGGASFRFESGDMPVRPAVECDVPIRVHFRGRTTSLAAGSWRLNDVLFERGWNELWVNSWGLPDTTWDYVGEGGGHPLTWGEAAGVRWDELARLAGDDGMVQEQTGLALRTWDELALRRWEELAGTSWDSLGYRAHADDGGEAPEDVTVWLRYEWGDL